MARKPYTIWDEIDRMQAELNSLFGNFSSISPWMRFNDRPLLLGPKGSDKNELVKYRSAMGDMIETDSEFLVNLEIPGVSKQDIKINVDDDGIEVKAERKNEFEKEDKKKGTYSAVRSVMGFYRHLRLPENVEVKRIAAKYKDGVLELKLPKSKKLEKKGFEVKIN